MFEKEFVADIIVDVPKNVGNDKEGAQFLSKFFQDSTQKNKKISVDFKNTRWFRANLTSVLGAICWNASLNGNVIIFKNLNPSIKRIFAKNHFLKKFGIPEIEDNFNSTIRYMEFEPEEKISFSEYVRKEFIPSLEAELPKSFEQDFRTAIEELFQNCRLHGKCKKIFVCGQYFPSEKRLYFSITNIGATIKENIEERFKNYKISPSGAIIWATKKGNTTRIENNIGGIGLDFLINFLDSTKGKIHIISDAASYERENKIEDSNSIENKFSGTIVTLVFSLNDICRRYERINFFENIEILENFF
ncbi:hypothetical protein [Fusobacterium varium]|uniref:hypothetical protein n=1 Tax=Fusobacterium varium TaxID=856 RepID=UPI000E422F0D|nr:hypothetical protein [Fusobacterium varium]RGJ30452.1 hypothetical protein DXD66_05185 [Fusobacterium varium]